MKTNPEYACHEGTLHDCRSLLLKSLALVAMLTAAAVPRAEADLLCYQANTLKAKGYADAQVFSKSCPKGYRAVSESAWSSVIQAGSLQIKGVPGIKGPTGDSGAVGVQGEAGPQGVPGVAGPQGDQGPTGATGATGSTTSGDIGPSGIAGVGTDKLFRFSGATGSLAIAPNSATPYGVFLPPSSVQKPATTDIQSAIASSPLLGTSCTKIKYFAEVSSAPTASNVWAFKFVVADPADTLGITEYHLCDISGDSTKCAGTAEVSIPAHWSGTVAFKGSDDAIFPVKAHWSVLCLAS